MPSFGDSADVSARVRGADQALKNMGMDSNPHAPELDKTRTGAKVEKAPKVETMGFSEYSTSGTTLNPKIAFYSDAPNYGKASSKGTNCASCKHFQKMDKDIGNCNKYAFYARNEFTCDAWTSIKGGALNHFKKGR